MGMPFFRTFALLDAPCYHARMKISTARFKKIGKKAAAITAGVFTAVALALSGLADTPDELFCGTAQAAVATAETNRRAASNPAAPARKERLRDRLRRLFLAQPSAVRGAVLLPFWAAGKVLITLLSPLFAALSPALQAVLGTLLNAALLFGLFLLVFRLLFPGLRLRDFLTKRNLLLLIVGTLVLSAVDLLLRVFWADYRLVSIAIKLGAGLLILALLCRYIFGARRRSNGMCPV